MRLQNKPYPKELYQTRIYRIWSHMLSRCNNPKVPEYNRYGGRGISVCKQWHNFADFYSDMSQGYSEELEIDRINNDGNYEPGNCRWATPKQNCRNRRSNRYFTINGVKRTLAEWIEHSSVRSSNVRQRFYVRGWSIEKSLGMEQSLE